MIISASRRTDIPSYYADWFLGRLREGYVLVRNPMNAHQVSRIELSPATVDGFVFWTKDPAPMLSRLDELEPYPYYFTHTLNAYGEDTEPVVPDLETERIPTFQQLARQIGPERVVWRYDPIFFTDRYTAEYHRRVFRALAAQLSGSTAVCETSFLRLYAKTKRNMRHIDLVDRSFEQRAAFAAELGQIADEYGIRLRICSDPQLAAAAGLEASHCIDVQRLARIAGRPMKAPKDKNQRPECGCSMSVDIGTYDTCRHSCAYCYANRDSNNMWRRQLGHDPGAPMLLGHAGPQDIVTDRAMPLFTAELEQAVLPGLDVR